MRHLCFHKDFLTWLNQSHTKYVMNRPLAVAPLLSTQCSVNGIENPEISKTRKIICIFLSSFAQDSNSLKTFGGQEGRWPYAEEDLSVWFPRSASRDGEEKLTLRKPLQHPSTLPGNFTSNGSFNPTRTLLSGYYYLYFANRASEFQSG